MDPMYTYMMPPHSYHNQTVPPFMYMNPTQPPLNWPWGSGYPYPPVACHGCCMPSHNAWRPPYSHIPPPYYPPFPTQYAPPEHRPFPYPRDQHCCGCPNHLGNQKSVRIEEEVPEREEINKIAPKSSNYPVIWFPTDDKEHNMDSEHNMDRKTDEKQPGGWYPLEANKPWSPKEKGERRGGHESDDVKGRYPFPWYWMPNMPDERENEEPTKENLVDPKLSLEPVKGSGEKAGGQPRSVVKYIPVKELKPHEENPTPTTKDRGDSSIKDVTGSKEKLTKSDSKSKSSSPPKSSKLPPVCLRVDPLPRRKDTSGSSRSSSLPEDKKKLDQVSTDRKSDPVSKVPKEGKGVAKSVKVVNVSTSHEELTTNQTEEKHEKERIPAECTKSSDAAMEVQSEDTGSARAGNGGVSSVKEEAKTPSKPKLSETDAAVIIQSTYRGFDIRRWEPVKKLKEIARVREQVAQVRELIQAMESSSYIQGDSKQRNIVAETIMSLLLKLDMIQGLSPSVREVRKSVVRELVCLQEKLDILVNQKQKALQEQESIAERRVENVLKETQSDMVESCQNQFDGVLNQASELLDKKLVTPKLENEASEVSESCMPKGSGSSIDGVDSVLGCGTECSIDDVVDSLSDKNEDKTESEQLLEVASDLHELLDAKNQSKKSDDGMSYHNTNDRENHDTSERERDGTESFDQMGVPHGDINTKSDVTDITNSVDGLLEDRCTSCGEFGTTKQVGSGCKPDVCSAQSPKSAFSDILKSPVVADKKDNPIAEEAPIVEDTNSNALQEDISVVEEAPDMLPMKEYEAEQEPRKETMDIDEKVAEEISSEINVSDQFPVEQREETEDEKVFDELKQTAQSQEHFLLERNCKVECVEGEGANEDEHTPETVSVLAATVNQGETISRDDEKLIEENEKLRDMVEKLVKSGEEQLRVISSLSGRVKHLERNLSKKRKLKLKPQKGKQTPNYRDELV